MPNLAEVYRLATPGPGQLAHTLILSKRIVAAQRHQTAKRQVLTRHRQPAASLQGIQARVAGLHGAVEIGRGRQQGATHRIRMARDLGPVRHHDAASAMRDDHDWTLNGGDLALDGLDTVGAVQVLSAHGWDRTHLGQAGRKQGLPMLAHVVAQAGDDKNGWGR